jgi:hypothetical protein
MTRLRSLIKEALSQPKKKDCGCGCNDCGSKAPILTESKVKHLISEGLQYHMDKKISLFESVYRMGSEKHFELIREARALWVRGIIDVSEDDQAILETHLGNFGMYEGEKVPLDMPMVSVNEDVDMKKVEKKLKLLKKDNPGKRISYDFINGGVVYKIDGKMVNEVHKLLRNNDKYLGYSASEQIYYVIDSKTGKEVKHTENAMAQLYGSDWKEQIDEAKKKSKSKKKDPPLNKPKRGGSKAYYVYVRDPKTKKIKKVSFGSGGLRAKIKNKQARNAFAARHNCKNKKDRTKAGYWSCNLPRYAEQLGLGSKMNTFW